MGRGGRWLVAESIHYNLFPEMKVPLSQAKRETMSTGG